MSSQGNALDYTDRFFIRCFYEVAKDCPEIQADEFMADAACYSKGPKQFAHIYNSNQYGDILSDLAARPAELLLAPGSNVGDGVATFKASH